MFEMFFRKCWLRTWASLLGEFRLKNQTFVLKKYIFVRKKVP